jgi:hypothetical protein
MRVEVERQSANWDKCEDDLERHIVRFRVPWPKRKQADLLDRLRLRRS